MWSDVESNEDYLNFVNNLKAKYYKSAFAKTVSLAKLREVPSRNRLETKNDIDNYFNPKRL